MGDTWVSGIRSGVDDTITFIESREEHLAEVNRPDAIVDFFEADVVRVQGGGEIQQALQRHVCAG